jgi:hypothetical protein
MKDVKSNILDNSYNICVYCLDILKFLTLTTHQVMAKLTMKMLCFILLKSVPFTCLVNLACHEIRFLSIWIYSQCGSYGLLSVLVTHCMFWKSICCTISAAATDSLHLICWVVFFGYEVIWPGNKHVDSRTWIFNAVSFRICRLTQSCTISVHFSSSHPTSNWTSLPSG